MALDKASHATDQAACGGHHDLVLLRHGGDEQIAQAVVADI